MTLRETGLQIFRAALRAGDAGPLVTRALGSVDLSRHRRVLVVGAGKASGAMARALEGVLGDRISDGLVVVKDGYTAPTRRIKLVEAGHPIPDERGLSAASEILTLAGSAGADDLVIVLISGGGSALTPCPAPPITLREKQALTRLFLAAASTINELNAVRKHCSLFKGGRLAQAASPAPVLALILSDVIGDPLDVIASGPTAPDQTTYSEALAILDRFGLRAKAPRAVVEHLERGARGGIPETPKADNPLFRNVQNIVIGNNSLVVQAAVREAEGLGFHTHVLTRSLRGEARETAKEFVRLAQEIRRSGKPAAPPACLIAGGETTVTVKGKGRGGRCQEFALAAALAIQGMEDVLVLAAGTDGTDGPTDAAGAVADGNAITRAQRRNLDAQASLEANDSYRFFSGLGDLVKTGPTNTNLLDLYLLLVGPLPSR
ncbi:MAG: glycerate kinase [Candidatus Rokubacteria bacterium]|nr:glycerate kinase [Candidatus Rokubacteria bacterium]MBI2553206.1 glycerate kinase [Candidatus Rokubacteria bacterium]